MQAKVVRRIRITIGALLLLLFIFANIYVIRQLMDYGLKLYFYDKMLVAYQIGGSLGLDRELASVLSQQKTPREVTLAKAFKENLHNLKASGEFLRETTESLKKKSTS